MTLRKIVLFALSFISGMVLLWFIYWMSGGTFERGEDLGAVTIMGMLVGVVTAVIVCVFDW